MKYRQVILVIVASIGLMLYAQPGLYKATFTGSAFDTTSDVIANASGVVLYPDEMYATSLPARTTVAWAGYMLMSGGVIYNFKGCYDDYVAAKIDDEWVLSKGGECSERTGSFTPDATGWYKVEFRVGNNGGDGGCRSSSQYGILWNACGDTTWKRVSASDGNGVFCTLPEDLSQIRVPKTTPLVLSSSIRENDPTILDVTYIVLSSNNTVKVRALAFEDGERSFWKVVRPETFVNDPDGNPTAQNIGDNIVANVEHKLAWKVSSDWATDLAKVKFEILTSDMGQLPLDWVTIPGVNGMPDISVTYNSQTDANVLNALYWYYACGANDLTIDEGYLKSQKGTTLVSRTTLSDNFAAIEYVADKMGLEMFGYSSLYHYVVQGMRKFFPISWHALCRKGMTQIAGLRYIGERAYCVIDISAGISASSYPVSYVTSVPLSGWGNEYKTTKILLRRIEPGTVTMGGKKPVTLTKPFYIGVFEITQKQYQLVTGANPSDYKGDMRPVEKVSWNDIRGNYNWPNVLAVAPSSFIGRLRVKTGLNFDLPTESQWEYACRAGTTSYYNNGGSSDNDLKQLGRYMDNSTDGHGGCLQHTVVGSYSPNAWGLYDMHGNVYEWSLDWYGSINADPAVDFLGVDSGSDRVFRSGGWDYTAYRCESSCRYNRNPSSGYNFGGFRLCWTLSE